MKKRYWTAEESEHILDYVNDNVIEAIRYFWEDDPPVTYITDFDKETNSDSIFLNNAIKSGEAIKKSTAGKYCYIYTL